MTTTQSGTSAIDVVRNVLKDGRELPTDQIFAKAHEIEPSLDLHVVLKAVNRLLDLHEVRFTKQSMYQAIKH
jgi:hypothetical protein